MNLRRLTGPAAAVAALLCTGPPPARADAVAYLVNVTVRPGYNFPNADAALAYGDGICGKVRAGERYAQIMREVKEDFGNPDEYQASYLISQAVGELCPAQIWQLRQSAAGYVPPTGPVPQ
ncbi:DUF732 domain-containing protein [Mycobacterium paraseoulense]|uniref:DUF732 domain-containing protein n=1 Tax=Mycobacterium paraseoulense TaxID=590652 RepID=A0A1X0I9S6_9MYCO|nr:DUF732 domain-containing protein [Mycobacterium paraseoulense]MCV7394431.1 DUF732 domain-containing protein [Mycobacterium paraseoulense]ORB40305.1 hypothetical protein BST39_14610 [Mycobacterium paraseoulense]BBZ74198.1 membrane protein [Mycobacterium paraseoulense]